MTMNALIIPHVKIDSASTLVHTEIHALEMHTAKSWATSLCALALMVTLETQGQNANYVRDQLVYSKHFVEQRM